jgi:hypothetical protein
VPTAGPLPFCEKLVMKTSLSRKPPEAAGSFELGGVLGQRKAFNLIAGRCSAAEAEAIRRLPEEQAYKAPNLTWREFCSPPSGHEPHAGGSCNPKNGS